LLAGRFHRCVHGLDEAAAQRSIEAFMTALAAAPDAYALAGTALLLTMMLLLSREGPLPDRRHQLYTSCLRNMLKHRVDQREREGAVLDADQFRPVDSAQRMRAVARLAYRVQAEGYQSSHRAQIIRHWNDAVALLDGEGWTGDQCDGFLRWLVASAGVLGDQADGSVHFTHLSFQEHLAAYHLYLNYEGRDRLAAVQIHMGDRDWWETLRLWAGLTGDDSPDKLTPVLDMLRKHRDGYWLAGMVFADGGGRPADFERWVAELGARLSDPFADAGACADAWQRCKQQDARRAAIAKHLQHTQVDLDPFDGAWRAAWCETAGMQIDRAPVLQALERPVTSATVVAHSRALLGVAAAWPDGAELAVLRLWPSARSRVSTCLAAAIEVGAPMSEVVVMLPHLLAQASFRDDQYPVDFHRDFGRYFRPHFVEHFVRDFVRNLRWRFIGHYARNVVPYFGWHLIRDFVREFGWHPGREFAPRFVRSFVRDVGRILVQYLGPDFVRDFGRGLGLADASLNAAWLAKFALLELSSAAGRAAPRSALAYGSPLGHDRLLAMFRAACQASFAADAVALLAEAKRACEAFDGDPLWAALARHVARISTDDDRALLEELARHPEQRPPPLSWGLQFYVRGDQMLADGSVVMLDELCTRAGVPSPPLLEPMLDELDIDEDLESDDYDLSDHLDSGMM
jgi:hypothetical protein